MTTQTTQTRESHAGLLRCATAEIAQLIPNLAPGLAADPLTIHTAIGDLLSQRGLPPADVSPNDLNRVERHAMARHLAGELHNEVIEGSGPEARLRFVVEPRRLRLGANGGLDGFKRVFQETLNTGATRVEETFTNGSDAEHRWWPLAARRYRNLGKAAVKAAPPVFDPIVNDKVAQVPREGQNLKAALRTQALSDLLPFYGDLVRTLDGTEEQRVEAAHSLVHILTSLAGIHGSELLTMMARRRLRAVFGGQVVRDPATGTYRVTYPPSNQPQGPKAYERLQDLPSTTIKCAARPYIKNFAHAAINAAAERHLM